MKAILIKKPGGAENLYLGEAEIPRIAPDEVLVKVHATALNRADLLQRRGYYPPPPGASEILGLEMAGEIVETGNKVEGWNKGDRVFALLEGGGYAEYVKVHHQLLLPIPKNLSYEDAAGIAEAFLTAWQALVWHAELQPGETILIHAGASGVGTAAIQIARERGATVLVTASPGKHALCARLGAHHCIDYKSESFDDVVLQEFEEGVDVIIDFVGAAYLQQNLNTLAMDGRMVLLGLMGGSGVEDLDISSILRKRLTICGSTLRARDLDYKIRLCSDFAAFSLPLFGKGRMKPVIDSIYDWTKVQQAHAYMEANRNKGKIILLVD